MSSQVEQEQFIEGLREDGMLDSLDRSLGRTEAPETDTVVTEPESEEVPAEEPEAPEEEPEETPEAEPEEEPVVEEEPPAEEAPEPEGEWTIDLTPETEEYLSKYGGDLNEALKAAASAQSLIGRQGNELGEVRRELQEMRDAFEQYQQQQPYQQPYRTYMPDPEEADEEEMAAAYASLATEAVERGDADTLGQAVEAWGAIQPFQASQFVNRLQQEAYANELARLQAANGGNELQARMEELKTKHPDLPQAVNEIGEEAQKSPTLARLLQEGTPEERVGALEELYLRVANRKTSETSQQALRRVAVKTSEEARRARQQAQVATSGRGPIAEPEAPPHLVALGRTGRFVDLDRVDEILQSDRI